MQVRSLGAVAIALCIAGGASAMTKISGAGSTFVTPVLTTWSTTYEKNTGNTVSYQSLGSGTGLQLIRLGAVDFGASDMPMDPDTVEHANLIQFPVVIGGVVPVVNVEGIKPGTVHFTGEVLADIYLGKVTHWNDPAIAALNPGVALPSAAIVVVHRADGSGTTFNWASYLGKMSPAWKTTVGEGTSLQWPVGISGTGNAGVAHQVEQTKNAIGYVEYAYAIKEHLAYGLVQNSSGAYVQPGPESFAAAASNADWTHAKDFYLVLTNAPGAGAWPITATTFVLVSRKPTRPEQQQAAMGFFRWALDHGQQQASSLGYVPLPADLVREIEATWPGAPRS